MVGEEKSLSAVGNVLIINGSPKGENSITMQYVRFIAKHLPRYRFETVHVAKNIAELQKDTAAFETVMAQAKKVDAILFGFGVWVLGVSCQLMSFL